MAHNIRGEQMFYNTAEGLPWHGLGVPLPEDRILTFREAGAMVKGDYNVETVPCYAKDGDVFKAVPGYAVTVARHSLIGSGQDEILVPVTESFSVIQNQMLMDAADAAKPYGFVPVTGGVLGKGERFWLMGQYQPDVRYTVAGDDILRNVCLTNSHDGGSACRGFETSIRVVCENTLRMALSAAKDGIWIPHKGDPKSREAEAARFCETLGMMYQTIRETGDRLADWRVSQATAEKFLREMFPDKPGTVPSDPANTYNQQARNRVQYLSAYGRGNAGHRGTGWALYNGLTDWAGHERRGTGPDADAGRKFSGLMWGSGARLRESGLKFLVSAMKDETPTAVAMS